MTFSLSQLILIASILLFIFYVFRLRTILTDRIIYLLMGFAGIVLVIHPDLSSRIANRIGIGRGADLIFYMFVVFMLFHYVSVASRFRKIERQLTMIVRKVSIDNAIVGSSTKSRDKS
jgi:small membrane protein